MKPKVSLLTVTQYDRLRFLCILSRQVALQTSPSIHEWVIVDGSKSDDDQERLREVVESPSFFVPGRHQDIVVRYVSTVGDPNRTIGHLRNVSNRHVKGPVVVCMDDDDYYPPERVTATLRAFKREPQRQLAGCCNHFIYEPDLDMIFQFTIFAPHHTVNTCMAYTIGYAQSHVYKDDATYGEEESFTNGFQEPMAAVPAGQSVVQMCHSVNTYSKRTILFNNLCYPEAQRNCLATSLTLADLIRNPDIRSCFLQLFEPRGLAAEEDVAYYCGHLSIVWDPEEQSLGGSEHAVVELSTAMAARGLKVAVYGNFGFEGVKTHRGVVYRPWTAFRVGRVYKNLILWRLFGLMPLLSLANLQARRILVDLHDTSPECYELIKRHLDRIHAVAFKSRFHYSTFVRITSSELPHDKVMVCPNGVRVETFATPPAGILRDRFRCIYASCYTRGLRSILKHTWPIVRHMEPRAHLDVYYGMKNVPDQGFKTEMETLLKQPGVTDHGRVDATVIAREKWRCGLHLYFTGTPVETDCLSIRESLVTGCVPVLSTTNVFAERDGAHLDMSPDETKSYIVLAKEVVSLMRREDLDHVRDQLRKSPTITTWAQTADVWMSQMEP